MDKVRGCTELIAFLDDEPVEAKDKPCPPNRHEGPRNRCITDSQEENLIKQRERKRERLKLKQEKADEAQRLKQGKDRAKLSKRQQRQHTRVQIASTETTDPSDLKGRWKNRRWDAEYPHGGVDPKPVRDPEVVHNLDELEQEGLSITGSLNALGKSRG